MRRKLSVLAMALATLVAACGGTSPTTTEPLLVTTTGGVATTTGASTSTTEAPAEPLIAAGCETFDATTLTELSPIDNELALIENRSLAESLVCNFVGVSNNLDTAVRIEVEPTTTQPDGYFTTPGEFESPIEISGRPGVGSGRGILRVLLSDDLGVSLTVTMRSLGSDAPVLSDGEFLAIRDAIAAYVVESLT